MVCSLMSPARFSIADRQTYSSNSWSRADFARCGLATRRCTNCHRGSASNEGSGVTSVLDRALTANHLVRETPKHIKAWLFTVISLCLHLPLPVRAVVQ